jgi:hypothetical protein
MELVKLFNTFISYGAYVRKNEPDGLKCWETIKDIVDKYKHDSINEILGSEWKISRSINHKWVNNLQEIYDFVHNTLKIYGESKDDIKYKINPKLHLIYHFYLQLARIPLNKKLELITLLQIAYNVGQLSVHLDNKSIFTPEAKDYYHINKLHDINSYINLDDKKFDDDQKDILNKIMIDVREKISIVLTGGFRKKNLNDVENLESKTNYLNKYLKYKKKYLSLKKYTRDI